MSIDAEDDARWMRAALALARRGIGRTAPNPAVGCVLVRDGRLLGRGWTKPGGRPHAERVALDQAAAQFGPDAARGATAYVTLEPCAHHGRTPPCADALVASGVARVVACLTDPDPRVQGRGFARLREAGIATECGLMAAEAAEINAGFLMRHRLGRPWLTLKMAASLDGRIATASGESRWITGPQARARVHLMRARADAILVGAGTLRADDPALDVRLPGLAEAAPLPVLLDPRLTLPPESRLAQGAAARPTLAFHAPGVDAGRAGTLAAMGVELAEAPPRTECWNSPRSWPRSAPAESRGPSARAAGRSPRRCCGRTWWTRSRGSRREPRSAPKGGRRSGRSASTGSPTRIASRWPRWSGSARIRSRSGGGPDALAPPRRPH